MIMFERKRYFAHTLREKSFRNMKQEEFPVMASVRNMEYEYSDSLEAICPDLESHHSA